MRYVVSRPARDGAVASAANDPVKVFFPPSLSLSLSLSLGNCRSAPPERRQPEELREGGFMNIC